MCGIVITPAEVSPTSFLERIASRGPDGRGLLKACGYNFGFRRLEIVADSEDGAQPYEDDEVIVMFNGELYNWDKTTYASEILWLASLVKKCRDFPRLLDGQFFVVVYYKDRGEFVFARDPLGIIPGYFLRDKQGIHIFSEKLDPMAEEVVPGRIYTKSTNKHNIGPYSAEYWLPSLGSREIVIEEVAAMLGEAALKIRRHSDVPVSFALGGLDSMIILCLLKRLNALPDEVFTVAVDRKSLDMVYARSFCEWLGVKLMAILVSRSAPRNESLIDLLSLRLWEDLRKNEVKHWGALRAALVAREAKYKVIMTGDGADELFYGYPYFNDYQGPSLAFKGLAALQSMHKINLDRSDRAGMLFGKEFRPVYLDRFFVNWMLAHRRRHDKADLRDVARYLGIPEMYITRPKWGADEAAARELI